MERGGRERSRCRLEGGGGSWISNFDGRFSGVYVFFVYAARDRYLGVISGEKAGTIWARVGGLNGRLRVVVKTLTGSLVGDIYRNGAGKHDCVSHTNIISLQKG